MSGRVLLIWASREGQTEKIATRLSEHLEKAGQAVHSVNAADSAATDEIDLGSYDLLVFGASIHAGGLERELVRFIDSNAERIEPKRRSFFLVSLSAATRDPQLRAESLTDARQKMQKQLPVVFDDVEMIAGALVYSKYSRLLKWVMKKIAASAGETTDTSRDYEYTDWQQVERYANRLSSGRVGVEP
jgi:menaquinone-dependent protoporphyrinogen oxidase